MAEQQHQGELVFYESHPAMFRARPFLFILFVLLCGAFGIGIILLAIWWVRTRGVTLTVTGRCSRLRTGLLSRHLIEVRHRDVRSLEVRQKFLQRLTNVGTISISTAADTGAEIVAHAMPNPMGVKEIIDQGRPPD